jgi:hypothetical protein
MTTTDPAPHQKMRPLPNPADMTDPAASTVTTYTDDGAAHGLLADHLAGPGHALGADELADAQGDPAALGGAISADEVLRYKHHQEHQGGAFFHGHPVAYGNRRAAPVPDGTTAQEGQPVYLYPYDGLVQLRPAAREAAAALADAPPRALFGELYVMAHGVVPGTARGLRCLAGHDMEDGCPGPLYRLGATKDGQEDHDFIVAEHDLEPVQGQMPQARDIAPDGTEPDFGRR